MIRLREIGVIQNIKELRPQWKIRRSVIGVFLVMEKSRFLYPGPYMESRPRSPGVPLGWLNASGLRYPVVGIQCGMMGLTPATTLGRWL
jgi:hypothetical protein